VSATAMPKRLGRKRKPQITCPQKLNIRTWNDAGYRLPATMNSRSALQISPAGYRVLSGRNKPSVTRHATNAVCSSAHSHSGARTSNFPSRHSAGPTKLKIAQTAPLLSHRRPSLTRPTPQQKKAKHSRQRPRNLEIRSNNAAASELPPTAPGAGSSGRPS
jgi:hypothetical protein